MVKILFASGLHSLQYKAEHLGQSGSLPLQTEATLIGNYGREQTDYKYVLHMTPLKKNLNCPFKIRNPRNHKQYHFEFQVVNVDGAVPLLGRTASWAMKLIKVHHENIMTIDSIVTTGKPATEQWTIEKIKTSYADVFTGDSCLEGKYKMDMHSTVRPVQLPKRQVPVALMKPLKE